MNIRQLSVWVLRAIWISLPVTAGTALADTLAPWSPAPRTTAGVLLWIGWAVILTATLLPRPLALTVTRIGTPVALALAIVCTLTGRPDTLAEVTAVVCTLAATALGTRGEFARACAQAAAYGDEERFPLRTPPGVAFVMVPVAALVIGAGIAVGPLLLADERWILGAIVTAVGVAVAWTVGPLVHQLSKRWVVLVPAGLVIADPLTLVDPVLFPRDRIGGVGPADPRRRPPDEALDIRLGAATGSCALLLMDDAPIQRRVRSEGQAVVTNLLVFAAVSAPALLDRAQARRIRVRRD